MQAAVAHHAESVWSRYYTAHLRFVARHRDRIWPEYENYLRQLGWTADQFPSPQAIDTRLRSTGWAVQDVDGYEPPQAIFALLAQRCFPLAGNLRSLQHVDYSPQPDAIHDLVGHVPFAFHRPLMNVTRAIAERALEVAPSPTDEALYHANARLSTLTADAREARAIDEARARVDALTAASIASPSALARLSRLYLWTAEFGLLKTKGSLRAIGAGLLSSHQELEGVLSGAIPVRRFDDSIFFHEVAISGHQEAVYAIEDLDDVYRLLEKVKN